MKRIACLGRIRSGSEQPNPQGILGTYNRLRIINAKLGITGLFIPYNEMVLQVLEGDSQKIALSMYKLRNDPQISDLTIISESDIEASSFSSWRAKFYHPDLANHREYLQKLRLKLSFRGSLAEGAESPLAAEFWAATLKSSNLQNPQKEEEKSQGFSHRSFHMTAWPRQTRSRFTPQLIKLCSSLTTGWVSYEALCKRGIYASQQELDEILKKLLAAEVVVMKDAPERVTPTSAAVTPITPPSDRFSNLMNRFISSKRREKSA